MTLTTHRLDPLYSQYSLRKIWHNLYLESEMVPYQMPAIGLIL